MANYDLTYEGSEVQKILDTGDELQTAGYIFRGEATPSTVPGTPTERVAYIGGPGTYTNFGSSITVGAGCICVFKYTGSAWSNQVINTGLSDAISSEAQTRSQADTALQNAITAINNNIGNGYVYAGVATPSTSPVTGKVFYLAVQAGTYTNFGNAVVTAGLNVIKYNGSAWSVDQVIAIDAEPTQGSANLVKSGGVLNSIIQNGSAFDLSAYNAQGGVLATYADLSAALTALNALPAAYKKGGMSVKYVQTYDNKYVQARCTANEFTTDITKWQNVDDKISELEKNFTVFSEKQTPTQNYDGFFFGYAFKKGVLYKIELIGESISTLYFTSEISETQGRLSGTLNITDSVVWAVCQYDNAIGLNGYCSAPSKVIGTKITPFAEVNGSTIINGSIPKDALGKILIDTIPFTDFIVPTFSNTGNFVNTNGSIGTSSNWEQAFVNVKKFDIINWQLGSTGSGIVLAKKIDDTHYKPLSDVVDRSIHSGIWIADEDCEVVLQCANTFRRNNVVSRIDKNIVELLSNVDKRIDNTEETLSKTIGVTTSLGFDFRTGEISAWKNRQLPYNFKAGVTYRFSIKTADATKTYFSLRDNFGNVVNNQNDIGGYVRGVREIVYTCKADASRLCMSLAENGTPFLYDVDVNIASDLSITNNRHDIDVNSKNIEITNSGLIPMLGYVSREVERVSFAVNERMNDYVAVFAFNTDQHFGSDSTDDDDQYNPKFVMRGIDALKNIATKSHIDLIVMGGDYAGYKEGSISFTKDGIIKDGMMLMNRLKDANSLVVGIPGNHEAYQNTSVIKSDAMYNIYAKQNVFSLAYKHSGNDNCDAYVDDDIQKIRYIFCDTSSANGRTESMKDFLQSALSGAPEDYKFIVFSHHPLTNEFAGIVKAYKYNAPSVKTDAFADPHDVHSILNAYSDRIIACICGHTHYDAWAVSDSGILYITTTCAAPLWREYTFDEIPVNNAKNQVTETSYDIFIVNQQEQTIEALRYGLGCDRKWKYKGVDAGQMSGYPKTIVR